MITFNFDIPVVGVGVMLKEENTSYGVFLACYMFCFMVTIGSYKDKSNVE